MIVGHIYIGKNKIEDLGALLAQLTEQGIEFTCRLQGDQWEIEVENPTIDKPKRG